MSRTQPYRSKMPVHILQLLDVATRITLFLVGQNGPLCFVFKDRLDNKYKTSIGANIHCTCSPTRNDHCIHSIYVLLKIFKMNPQNPLMWQAGYIDSELSDILAGKHTVAQNRRIIRPVFQADDSDLPSKYLFQKPSFIETQAKAQRMKLQQDSVCPICQQPMADDMCLTYCKVKCGNNFHLECIKVWAQHKSTTQKSITCPMCRTCMSADYLNQLLHEQKQFNKKEKKKTQFKCSGCGVNPIPNNAHKCLLCTSFELCQCCYDANKHIKHPFIKCGNDGRWHGARQRRQDQLKMKNYIQKRKKQSTNDKLLEKLRKVEEDPNKLLDYVASSYPYVSKYISQNIDPYKKLGFSSQDMRCMKCGSKKMIFLRRLTCGHFVDHQCMKEYIRKGKFHCEEDGTKFLKGYEDFIKRQQQLDNQLINRIQIKRQFDPSPLQREQYNFQRLEQAPTLGDVLGLQQMEVDHGHHQRIRKRLQSNMVRNNHQSVSSTRNQQPRNQIRIRQVSRSTNKRDRSEGIQPVQPARKVNRAQMQQMLEAMIGRKIF